MVHTLEILVYCDVCDEVKKVVDTLKYIRIPLGQEGPRKNESVGVTGKMGTFFQICLQKFRWLCGLT